MLKSKSPDHPRSCYLVPFSASPRHKWKHCMYNNLPLLSPEELSTAAHGSQLHFGVLFVFEQLAFLPLL